MKDALGLTRRRLNGTINDIQMNYDIKDRLYSVYTTKNFRTANPLMFGLAMVTGIGIILMILVLGLGVVEGNEANTQEFGMIFALGLLMTIAGAIAWTAVVRPFKNFDDINQPLEDDHHAHAHDEHALVVAEDAQVAEHH